MASVRTLSYKGQHCNKFVTGYMTTDASDYLHYAVSQTATAGYFVLSTSGAEVFGYLEQVMYDIAEHSTYKVTIGIDGMVSVPVVSGGTMAVGDKAIGAGDGKVETASESTANAMMNLPTVMSYDSTAQEAVLYFRG